MGEDGFFLVMVSVLYNWENKKKSEKNGYFASQNSIGTGWILLCPLLLSALHHPSLHYKGAFC